MSKWIILTAVELDHISVSTVERSCNLFANYLAVYYYGLSCLLDLENLWKIMLYGIGSPAGIGKGAGSRPNGRDREGRAWG